MSGAANLIIVILFPQLLLLRLSISAKIRLSFKARAENLSRLTIVLKKIFIGKASARIMESLVFKNSVNR